MRGQVWEFRWTTNSEVIRGKTDWICSDDEFIQVLKRIWTDDVVEFKGKYYSIPGSKIAPKPLQKPHPPIYMGGFSPNTFSRIVNYDINGWLAVTAGPLILDSYTRFEIQ